MKKAVLHTIFDTGSRYRNESRLFWDTVFDAVYDSPALLDTVFEDWSFNEGYGLRDLRYLMMTLLQQQLKTDPDAWIPVSERLPGLDDDYLICASNGMRTAAWFEDGIFRPYDTFFENLTLTHWMPLPEKPADCEGV